LNLLRIDIARRFAACSADRLAERVNLK